MASKRQEHHYFSVFIDYSDQRTVMQHFGTSERRAAWSFYQAALSADRDTEARAVTMRRDSTPVAYLAVRGTVRSSVA